VEVASVSTANVKGKVKRTGRVMGKRADWKKAYVTLADGADLNFLGE
jgi:large subunit ribosomal protein L23